MILYCINIRRPRPSPRPGRRLGPPQVWNLSCRTTLQNPPNPPKPSKPSKHSPKPSKPSKHLPQQAPQGQGHFPNRHPRAKATAMAFYGLSKLPFARLQTLQTFQNPPNPPNPPKPSKPSKHRPQQAPQGQGHSNGFLLAFKAAVCQPANAPNAPKPSKPSKTVQTLQTPSQNPPNPPKPSKPSKHLPQQAPQGQGHFSNKHPRAKATAMAFYWLSKLPFASLQTLQTLQNHPNPPKPSKHPLKPSKPSKPSKTFQTLQTPSKTLQTLQTPSKPSKHLPQQAPQGQGHFPNRHPRAKAAA